MLPPIAIDVQGLTKRFGAITAVDDVTFSVAVGATTALLGGNGAGKTTTLSMLLGLLEPSAGAIRVLGHDLRADRFPALARMNFSSPYVDVPHRLTVRENLRVYAGLYGVSRAARRIAELARDLDLDAFLDRATGSLSAGQRTRVALAKALVNRPELLLLDEPTASLDPDTADWVRGYLADYQRTTGATILLASHNMSEVERLAAEVLMLSRGRLVDQGAPAALVQRYGRATLEEVFLDVARGTGVAADAS
jgi:ABC-2 type transport system ATP-binding protein